MKLESIYLIVATVDSSLLLGLYTATYIRLKRGSQYKKVMNIVVLLIASNVGTLLNSWGFFMISVEEEYKLGYILLLCIGEAI